MWACSRVQSLWDVRGQEVPAGGRAGLGRGAPEEQLTQGVQGCKYRARSCWEGAGFLPQQLRREGVSKVSGLRDWLGKRGGFISCPQTGFAVRFSCRLGLFSLSHSAANTRYDEATRNAVSTIWASMSPCMELTVRWVLSPQEVLKYKLW